MKTSRRNVGGVELEMVRFKTPCPHWRVKVVETGYIFESGVFMGCRSQSKVWDTVEDTARRRGESWFNETMTAHEPLVKVGNETHALSSIIDMS